MTAAPVGLKSTSGLLTSQKYLSSSFCRPPSKCSPFLRTRLDSPTTLNFSWASWKKLTGFRVFVSLLRTLTNRFHVQSYPNRWLHMVSSSIVLEHDISCGVCQKEQEGNCLGLLSSLDIVMSSDANFATCLASRR